MLMQVDHPFLMQVTPGWR